MSINIMGFATSILTDDLSIITNQINIKITTKINEIILEEAMTNIESNEVCICKTNKGSIILVGDDFPILDTKLRPLSENENAVLRFIYGESSGIFLFEIIIDGKVIRQKSIDNDKVNFDRGTKLDIEYSGLNTPDIIMEAMRITAGDNIFTLEPDHVCCKYKFF